MERLIRRYSSSSPSTYLNWSWHTNLIHLDSIDQVSQRFVPAIAGREERITVLGRSLRQSGPGSSPPGKRPLLLSPPDLANTGHHKPVRNHCSKTESDRSLLYSVRDDRFKQLRICVWVQLDDPEIVQVRPRGDLLNFVRLGILNIDHIFSSVLKPADQNKVTKGPDRCWWPFLSAFCSRLSRLRDRRRTESPWIGSRFDFLVRILRDYTWLPCCIARTVAVFDVLSIGP